MKKIISILMVLMLILTGIGCGDKEAESQNTPEDLVKEAEQTKEEVEAMYGSQEYTWPSEADALGVPELKKGKINGLGITDKGVAIGYEGLTRDDIEDYKELLLKEGFAEGEEYPGGGIWNYVKNESDGAIQIAIAFGGDDGAASIVINPTEGKLAVLDKTTELKWPDAIPKEVPVFSKGTMLKSFGDSAMSTIEYKDVNQADVDDYKNALADAGYEYDEEDSSENSSQFEKVDQAEMSITIIGVDYKDGYLTLVVGSY